MVLFVSLKEKNIQFSEIPCITSHGRQEKDPEHGCCVLPGDNTLLAVAYVWYIPPSFISGNNGRAIVHS